ncbi:MAG: hypothetical protein OEO19_07435 [Gammaproteobacteria bacterium]|nr:hypothetical protein [Gammaproteobacteria bacterium]
MLITNPFADSLWALIFPIVCAFFVVPRDIAIRYLPQEIPSSQVAFTNAWVVMRGGGAYSIYQGWGDADPGWYFWFLALTGVLYCGYLIWEDRPNLTMLAGATVIVVSGIILLSTEKRRNRRANLATVIQQE